ncbi:uncharacterized protein LOC128987872 [Macrosteles quadrilineatus]|uniref:uncharacterized protein LOC128987872 n=1 Tax=Macrosteles quadrilineatus TaxID=74068 RepID=UPI0023E22E07|nr:uncharacterized protein LOC128987872 [Macrosteles quadrilineatus]
MRTMVKFTLFCFTFTCLCLSVVLSESTPAKPCDPKVIQCIKDINGGNYPVKAWSGLQILFNHFYEIRWYSGYKVDKFDCISTSFGLFGNKDTYTNQCKKVDEVIFKTELNSTTKEFLIKDYKGVNMNAYAIYFKKYCLALYVCSANGVLGPHVTIYCPKAKRDEPEVLKEIEEAKTALTKCNINDGVATCQKKCP